MLVAGTRPQKHLLESRKADGVASMTNPVTAGAVIGRPTPNGYAAVIMRMLQMRTTPNRVEADTLTLAA